MHHDPAAFQIFFSSLKYFGDRPYTFLNAREKWSWFEYPTAFAISLTESCVVRRSCAALDMRYLIRYSCGPWLILSLNSFSSWFLWILHRLAMDSTEMSS